MTSRKNSPLWTKFEIFFYRVFDAASVFIKKTRPYTFGRFLKNCISKLWTCELTNILSKLITHLVWLCACSNMQHYLVRSIYWLVKHCFFSNEEYKAKKLLVNVEKFA